MTNKFLAVAALGLFGATSVAQADVGIGLRAGSPGYGVDLNVGLTEKLSARLGYNFLNYDETVEDTDVRYDGTLKIDSFSTLLDWYAFGGGFRFTFGAVFSGPKVELLGTPTGGTYEIGGSTYTAAEIGNLSGEIKFGNSTAPYVGIGYGNVVSEKHRITFLFDLGAMYGGTPNVTMTANCGASVPAQRCAELQADVQTEVNDLENDTSSFNWYPVLSLGIGIRF